MSNGARPPGREQGGAGGRSAIARLLHPVDSVIAIGIIAFCGWLLYETGQFDEVSFLFSQNIPPELFPRILIVVIILFCLALPFEHILLTRKGKDIDKGRRDKVSGMTWLTMLVLVATVSASPLLGTYLTMVAVCIVLPLLWHERRLHYILAFAAVFPAAVTVLFNLVLGVFFEPGMIGIAFH